MMGWYGSWLAMGLFGGLLLLVWVAVVLVVVWAVRALFPGERRSDQDTALEILRRRYAAGEISQAGYEDARRTLGWDRRIEMEHDNDEIERRRTTMKRRIAGLLAGAFLASALVVGGVSAAVANGLHGLHGPTQVPAAAVRGATSSGDGMGSVMDGYGSGMMGGDGNGGMMGGSGYDGMMSMMGQMGGPAQATSPAAARRLSQRVTATATIDRRTNTITYHTRRVELVALASPDSGPDMTWTVDGLVNPTVVIPVGAHVAVHFFDADNGTIHGWELTNTPPPYPYMAMMDAPVALPGAFAMPVSGATGQRWFGRTVRFTATNAGTYYYICPVPGHVQKRMHGTLVVR